MFNFEFKWMNIYNLQLNLQCTLRSIISPREIGKVKKKKNGIVINNGETNTGWPLDDNIIV